MQTSTVKNIKLALENIKLAEKLLNKLRLIPCDYILLDLGHVLVGIRGAERAVGGHVTHHLVRIDVVAP